MRISHAIFLMNVDFIMSLYDRLLELQKTFFKNYIDQIGKYAQIICYADGFRDARQTANGY